MAGKMRESKRESDKHIALMIFSVMTGSFVILFLFVHFFMRWYMRREALEAIGEYRSYVLSWEGDVEWTAEEFYDNAWTGGNVYAYSEPTLFQAVSIDTDENYSPSEEEWESFSGERDLLRWCRQHSSQTGEIVHAVIGRQEYYLEQIPFTYHFRDGTYRGISIIFVNISAIVWMLNMAEIIMAVLMISCVVVAVGLGLRTERSIREQREKQKRFFENASHELKTPLMSIQGFAEGLSEGVIEDPEHACGVILKETDSMAKLVDDILFLSKYDRDGADMKTEKLSVEELLGDCLDTLGAEILNRHLEVETEISDRFIMGDEALLTRALMNLLSNAVRYARHTIRITFDGSLLTIWDDGEEIPEEELSKIFERFHTGKGGSTGIGLSLTREILEAHGYSITAENRDGGAQFVIRMG